MPIIPRFVPTGDTMGDWTESYRGVVPATEYDADTSMNSNLYVSRFDQATWMLLHEVGLTPATLKAAGQRIAVYRQYYRFLRELRGGDLVVIRSAFIAVTARQARFIHRMTDHADGSLIATADYTGGMASLVSQQTINLPDDARARAEAMVIKDAGVGA